MNSPLSASSSFSALTTSEDAIAVLVLVETSGLMLSYWDEVKTFYLPVLLDTLRNAHNAKTVPVCARLQLRYREMHADTSSSLDATVLADVAIRLCSQSGLISWRRDRQRDTRFPI